MKIIRGNDIGSLVRLVDYGDEWIIVEREDGVTQAVTVGTVSLSNDDIELLQKDLSCQDLDPAKVRFWVTHEIQGSVFKRRGARSRPMPITRHQLLAHLHEILQPKLYLEIGVHQGLSLALAKNAEYAIGVDPNPLIQASANQLLYRTTSDNYFATTKYIGRIDLAFIDGEHLAEFALRDFINVAGYSGPGTVVVFDDVLPYNSAIADRVMPPGGDWTGDVWKVWELLKNRDDLSVYLVDTFPTGTMVVWNWEKGLADAGARLSEEYERHERRIMDMGTEVPAGILDRRWAHPAQFILDTLRELQHGPSTERVS